MIRHAAQVPGTVRLGGPKDTENQGAIQKLDDLIGAIRTFVDASAEIDPQSRHFLERIVEPTLYHVIALLEQDAMTLPERDALVERTKESLEIADASREALASYVLKGFLGTITFLAQYQGAIDGLRGLIG